MVKVSVIVPPGGSVQTFTAGGFIKDGTGGLIVVSSLPPEGQPADPGSVVAIFAAGGWQGTYDPEAVTAP